MCIRDSFETVQMPDSFFDVAVGNVPFGDFKVLDKRYDKHHWLDVYKRQTHGSVIPLRSSLPVQCFSTLPSSGELILLTRGEKGYSPCYDFSTPDAQQNELGAFLKKRPKICSSKDTNR